ncbi:MAG: methylenetetrahydrofolate reductase C-terminal domain-containing protein [Sphingomonadales bacterium]|nr:methylenetetrahydrofolate reductase C-terminal domain-containing protein [Sphingomonadales bacterium]
MYSVRLWSVRHSRGMERVYTALNPLVLTLLRGLTRVFGTRLDGAVTRVEAAAKGFFFDCKMCGDCALSKTGMSCPMNCPKTIRNGPCGGVRENGMCEVRPQMRCVWVAAWDGASRMKGGDAIKAVSFAVDHSARGTSSWLKLARHD